MVCSQCKKSAKNGVNALKLRHENAFNQPVMRFNGKRDHVIKMNRGVPHFISMKLDVTPFQCVLFVFVNASMANSNYVSF